MGRALVIAALLVVCLARAHADGDDYTELKISVTDVTITGAGYWEQVASQDGFEIWKNANGDVRKRGQLAFSPPVAGGCNPYLGAEDVTAEYAFDGATTVYEGTDADGYTTTSVCTEIEGYSYTVEAMTFGGNLQMVFFEDIDNLVHSYIGTIQAKYEPAEPDHVDEPIVVPDTTLAAIAAVGRSLSLSGAWTSLDANVWQHSSGTTVTFEAATTSCDARGAELPRDLFEEYPDAELSRLDDLGATDELARVGVCLLVEGAAYWMTIEMPASLDPRSEPDLGAMIHTYVDALLPSTWYQHPRRRAGWILPDLFTAGFVRRSDDTASAWGFGLSVSRRPWHFERHVALGYEAALTLANAWYSGAAMVRPGIWAGAMEPQYHSGLLIDLYGALGVDATAGANAPATGTAVTFGGGFEGSMLTKATERQGMGIDLDVEVLADTSGFHSHTEEFAVHFGHDTHRLTRLGIRHVGDSATGSVWWFTVGITDLGNDR